MNLQNFKDDEKWLGSPVGGQSHDVDFGLSEAMEALDTGGRQLDSHDIECGLYKMMKKNQTWWFLDENSCAVDSRCVYVHISEPFREIESHSFLPSSQTLCRVES